MLKEAALSLPETHQYTSRRGVASLLEQVQSKIPLETRRIPSQGPFMRQKVQDYVFLGTPAGRLFY